LAQRQAAAAARDVHARCCAAHECVLERLDCYDCILAWYRNTLCTPSPLHSRCADGWGDGRQV